MAVKLCLSKAFSLFDFEANVACFFVATNPDWIATLIAGFILQNLVSLNK